jgi:exodeoxyribonuclease V alpha subunit
LPNEHQSVISRELIYTAITRAKTQFTLVASKSCWEQGLALQVERASGLRDILWP